MTFSNLFTARLTDVPCPPFLKCAKAVWGGLDVSMDVEPSPSCSGTMFDGDVIFLAKADPI
jgi:hypothetical protein